MVGQVTAKLWDAHPEPVPSLAVELDIALLLQEHQLAMHAVVRQGSLHIT